MKELVWLLPVLVSISLVLGTCRADSARAILLESTKSLGRIIVAGILIAFGLEGLLWLLPRVF